MVKFSLKSITSNSGQKIDISQEGIYVIVGPNNCGKSTLLREVESILRGGDRIKTNTIIVKDMEINKQGTAADFESFLPGRLEEFTNAGDGNRYVKGFNINTQRSTAINRWEYINNGLHETTPLFCNIISTGERLQVVSPPSSIDFLSQHPTHPIQLMADDDTLEKKLSSAVKRALGKDIVVNRGAGSIIPVHIGDIPQMDTGEDRISKSYLDKIRKLPLLQNQGDGIKSFIGSLMLTVISRREITLIDEPEAFLHPPQARYIGKLLGDEFAGDS